MTEIDIRQKFESWATENSRNLIRHPNDQEFYFDREVSMLWIAFLAGFAIGNTDATENAVKAFDEAKIELISRTLDQDD